MKAEELMIGDWVSYEGKPTQIEQLGPEGNIFVPERYLDASEHIEPIPLEKIHLAKNGFKVREYSDDTEYFYHDGYRINVNFDEGLPADNIPPTIYLSIDFAEKDIAMPIEYVHELQQAMRIMGCDKEIKL